MESIMSAERPLSPLKGIKVVDFSWLIAGPLTTRILADYGAEVIKVESPSRPDDMRAIPPYKDGKRGINRAWALNNYNTNKLGITLDLDNPKGLELAKMLIEKCDIMVENFRPGTIDRWGLDYKSVKTMNPGIIMISLTGTGQWGPMMNARFLGIHLQAYAGLTHFLGWPDRGPTAIPVPLTDFITPWFATVAVLAALAYRRRTGEGRYIDICQLETAAHFLSSALLDYSVNKRISSRQGNRHRHAAPHGVYRCKGDERWCAIAIFNNQDWKAFCEVLGNPEWGRDLRFATAIGRKQYEDELDRFVEEWTLTQTAEEVMEKLQKAGVDAAVVQNAEDYVDKDPQIKHRSHFVAMDHPEIGKYHCQQAPFRLSKTVACYEKPGPCLGEHNEYVCSHILGLSDEQFMEYLDAGAFGQL
jgi:benzylsuccinate CoA-transferase BbsF subunit